MSGEGGGVKGAALGKVFKVVMDLFALFGFARHLSVSGLNSFFLHSQGSVNLNKNQLFFCASIPSPQITMGSTHPMPQPSRSSWSHLPSSPAHHVPWLPNLSISIPKFRSLQETPNLVEISEDNIKIAGRATQEQNIPE